MGGRSASRPLYPRRGDGQVVSESRPGGTGKSGYSCGPPASTGAGRGVPPAHRRSRPREGSHGGPRSRPSRPGEVDTPRTVRTDTPAHHKTAHRGKARRVRLGPQAQAIDRAAVEAGVGLWHPNQLRHSFATGARKGRGLEAAQVLLATPRRTSRGCKPNVTTGWPSGWRRWTGPRRGTVGGDGERSTSPARPIPSARPRPRPRPPGASPRCGCPTPWSWRCPGAGCHPPTPQPLGQHGRSHPG